MIILRFNLYFSLNFIFAFFRTAYGLWFFLQNLIFNFFFSSESLSMWEILVLNKIEAIYVLSRRTRMMKELLRMFVLNRIEKLLEVYREKCDHQGEGGVFQRFVTSSFFIANLNIQKFFKFIQVWSFTFELN